MLSASKSKQNWDRAYLCNWLVVKCARGLQLEAFPIRPFPAGRVKGVGRAISSRQTGSSMVRAWKPLRTCYFSCSPHNPFFLGIIVT